MMAIVERVRLMPGKRIGTYGRSEDGQLPMQRHAVGVQVGFYHYGCFDICRVPSGITVGRYCWDCQDFRVWAGG